MSEHGDMGEGKDAEQAAKPLGLSRPGRLELKKTVEGGQVRQNFSHGRSKMVQVEVRKKRTYKANASGGMEKVSEEDAAARAELQAATAAAAAAESEKSAPGGAETPGVKLTAAEQEARARALEQARDIAAQAPPPAETTAADAVPAASESAPEAPAEAAVEAQPDVAAAQARDQAAEAAPGQKARTREDTEEEARRAQRAAKVKKAAPASRAARGEGERRRSGKLTIAEAMGGDEERQRSLASVKRARERERARAKEQLAEGKKVVREVVVPEVITVQELANRMSERAAALVKALMNMDVTVTATQNIDADTAELLVSEFGHKVKRVSESDVEIGLKREDDTEGDKQPRAPVVTVMGHVDHGKTSLLDALRQSDVAAHEAGGITQHIGAYQVRTASDARITFIDTPGHAAFTEMRARGAKVTDIVVLCVAADDGVMPQTVEAIDHAKAAGVPIIVAVNKIDKPGADSTKVRAALLSHEIAVEGMGGDVLAVDVSALQKTNLDKLEEAILLQTELLDLRANPDCAAEGAVVESKVEQGRGSVATVLVQRGTLRAGDIFVAGAEWGRVRAMFDASGKQVTEAGPSMPVEVLGLHNTPSAGDEVVVVESEARAREISEYRQAQERNRRSTLYTRGTIEEMLAKIKDGEAETLPVVIKADVHGSLEAILGALEKFSTDEVQVQVLHSGVGGINESDVTLAGASNAMIIAFNVRANPQAREHAKRDKIDIRYYSIIYDVTDDVKKMLSGMLSPEIRETFLGYADVREVFAVSKVGKVAGCIVTEGQVRRGAKVRLLRDDTVIHAGELSQLKRFKDDVKEVSSGTECGVAFANYHDIQPGDRVECFEVQEIAREL
ncbi:MAG: translation initiation factor IF-2 [Rhodospirillales bacterium]